MSAIFDQQEPEKSEFEKIGVSTIRVFSRNGRWLFRKNGRTYDMAPAVLTEFQLSPLTLGADQLIMNGCGLKGIKNPENGFLLLFSKEYFPKADAKFTLDKDKFGGWIYNVEEINLRGILPGQAAWVCPYLNLYFETPPPTLYLGLEADDGRTE